MRKYFIFLHPKPRPRGRQWLPAVVLALGLYGWVGLGHATPAVHLQGELVSITAKNEPLQAVLHAFQRQGVRVEVDPEVRARVNGRLERQPLAKALDQLLGQYSYTLGWKRIDGPVEGLVRLDSIRVFRPGHADAVRPLPGSGKLEVVTGPNGTRFVRGEVLVGLKRGMSLADFRALLARVNGEVVESIPALGMYRVRLPENASVPGTADLLRQFADIAAAEPNYVTDLPTGGGGPSGIDRTGLRPPAVAASGHSVAVLDSGLAAGVDFGPALSGSWDAVEPGQAISDPSGHGTQMALIATGAVAPNGVAADPTGVSTLAIRAFDAQGQTSNFTLMQAIDHAVAAEARILSLSWGTETSSEFMERSLGYAAEQGLLVVAAAGNEPNGVPLYPASYTGVIGVGALDASGQAWGNSNRGSFIDVAAPGTATFPVGHDGPPGAYAGTSIATPWVARAMSQYLQAYPQASNQQLIEAFNGSLQDAGDPGRDDLYGNGVFDDAAKARFLGTPPE